MLYACLIATAIFFAIQAIRAKRLIASALWLAGVSAVLSIVFYVMDAHTIAVIELSVGAGLVTVLFVFAISVAGEEAMEARPLLPRPLAWGLVILSVLLLAWLALPLNSTDLPATDLPASELSLTHVLWQQRGLDVLVQIVLIFAGVLGLLGLLAEAEAPLAQPVAKQIAAERDRELLVMQQQSLDDTRPAVTVTQFIRELRSPDNKLALKAVEELRACGWLSDGALEWTSLQRAHLQMADLQAARLQYADLCMARLQGADLSKADLQGTRLSKANLYRADLSMTNLQRADLHKANLRGARNLSDEQLVQAHRLRHATMPDGSRYDGRFNLVGDIGDARLSHLDINDPATMADFYDVHLEDYRHGQEWAQAHLPQGGEEAVERDDDAGTEPVLGGLAGLSQNTDA